MANTSINIAGDPAAPVTVALVGLGGFGDNYLRSIFEEDNPSVRLLAGADPEPWRSNHLEQLKSAGIPVYPDLAALFENHQPNLTVIAAPQHLHKRLTCQALSHESHVLCEKPAASTFRQALEMRHAQSKTGRTVAIGFQWSFSSTIAALKQDIASGALGRPKRLKSLVLWPRDLAYYTRNNWAGRIWSAGGEPICDNPVANACAHYLHNMLYVLGEIPSHSAWPTSLECETYRLNSIENFDTAAIRLTTTAGAELFLAVSHATATRREPTFHYEFENATVTYDLGGDGRVVARWNDGKVRDYGMLPGGTDVEKLWITVQAIRELRPVPCGIEAAMPHMAAASAVQEAPITALPASSNRIISANENLPALCTLGQDMIRCYDTWLLPGELQLPWSARKHIAPITPQPGETEMPKTSAARRKEHLV
jgi:predicted dehydrogenase